ncbi:hypothetical protein NDU88_006886 [Pleurodeles waltl]|uniref:Uncharacterized protein n=1 Tax=Pleurodeles waltl TaxID=8319 RepID=A0AAV7SQU5_PLEWA|nr:hypothetical protein NDU88_006886 [Pleurodeles waltl]
MNEHTPVPESAQHGIPTYQVTHAKNNQVNNKDPSAGCMDRFKAHPSPTRGATLCTHNKPVHDPTEHDHKSAPPLKQRQTTVKTLYQPQGTPLPPLISPKAHGQTLLTLLPTPYGRLHTKVPDTATGATSNKRRGKHPSPIAVPEAPGR